MKNELETLKEMRADIDAKIEKLSKPEFEVGKWYKSHDGTRLWHMVSIDGITQNSYGFYNNGKWHSGFRSSEESEFRLATPTEVQQALEKEAVKRGLWGDVKINAHVNPHKYESINTGDFITGFQGGDTFYNDNGAIFHNGTWATPIKTMTIDELASEISYTTKDKVVNYLTENKTKIIETLSNL